MKALVLLGVALMLAGRAPAEVASHGGHAAGGSHHGGSHSGGRTSAARGAHQAGNQGRGHANAARGGPQAGNNGRGARPRQQHAGAAGHDNGHPRSHHNYHVTHGRQFRHGVYYPGRYHPHWAYTRFDVRYGCTLYYDPELGCYYYWCEPDSCYYPVSYCPYNRYAWSTVSDERGGQEAGQLQVDLEDFEARIK
jgi:hypothetical protein